MTITELVLAITEIIGTIAFSASGALTAVERRLDVFGVVFIGCVTAVGGGILRDILLGSFPPKIFSDIMIIIIAVAVSAAVFVVAYINSKKNFMDREQFIAVNNIFDAIGLAAFSVMGTEAVFAAGFGYKFVFSVLMGMITGVGGGIFRDVMTNETPYVFVKHIYALASLGGSIVYYCIRRYVPGSNVAATLAAIVFIITVRMLATKYRWKLPKVKISNTKGL